MERFEKIGYQIMHRSGGARQRPYDASLGTRAKRKLVAGLLGQAFVVAWNTIRHQPRGAPSTWPNGWSQAGELYGDDVSRCSTRRACASPRSTSWMTPHGP